MIEPLKPNTQTESIRQSVISVLLKSGKALSEAQYFTGIEDQSTEKYKQTGLEELKAAIIKYHPLQ